MAIVDIPVLSNLPVTVILTGLFAVIILLLLLWPLFQTLRAYAGYRNRSLSSEVGEAVRRAGEGLSDIDLQHDEINPGYVQRFAETGRLLASGIRTARAAGTLYSQGSLGKAWEELESLQSQFDERAWSFLERASTEEHSARDASVRALWRESQESVSSLIEYVDLAMQSLSWRISYYQSLTMALSAVAAILVSMLGLLLSVALQAIET